MDCPELCILTMQWSIVGRLLLWSTLWGAQFSGYPAGDQIYSTEVQRWCPDRDCFAGTQDQLPTGQADVFEVCTASSCTWHHQHMASSAHAAACSIQGMRQVLQLFLFKEVASAAMSRSYSYGLQSRWCER